MLDKLIKRFKFLCWHCELWYGDADTPEEPSRLCESCKRSGVR